MSVIRRTTLRWAGLLAAAAAPSPASGQCQYEVTVIAPPDLGCPPYLTSPTGAAAVNEAGEVVGGTLVCASTGRAFYWSPQTGYELLPFPPGIQESNAKDLSEEGLIVGWMRLANDGLGELAYMHDGQQALNLGTLTGGTYSEALGINEEGCVVGRWGNTQNGEPTPSEAFVWRDGAMTGLGADLGTTTSWAADINDAGQVTGYMGESGGYDDGHAFVWEDGLVTVLPLIPGGFMTTGAAINEHGDVTGWGKLTNPETGEVENRGFVWIDGEMIVLDPLPGFVRAAGTAINEARQVVGVSWSISTARAFIWQNGLQTDLNDLIPEEANVVVKNVGAINNAGQIAGEGTSLDLQAGVGLLLTPVEPPLGDLDGDCRAGIVDLLELLANWGPCPVDQACPADLNGDGVVDVFDFAILLENWA